MGNITHYAACPPYTVAKPYLSLSGQGEADCPSGRVTYEDAPWVAMGRELREAQTELAGRSGL